MTDSDKNTPMTDPVQDPTMSSLPVDVLKPQRRFNPISLILVITLAGTAWVQYDKRKEAEENVQALEAEVTRLKAENAVLSKTKPTAPASTTAPKVVRQEPTLDTASYRDLQRAFQSKRLQLETFTRKNSYLWREGDDKPDSSRWHSETAREAIGKYSVVTSINLPDEGDKLTLDLDLELKGYGKEINRFSIRSKDKAFVKKVEFLSRPIGTDKERSMINFLIDNPIEESAVDLPYLGFRFPSKLKKKQKAVGKVMGLTTDQKWQELGSYTLTRKK